VPVAELLPWGDWVTDFHVPFILNIIIMLLGLFLMLLVLIQRGKGGGLSGAFGGAGGSSAFGSRAGDQFTRITLITAAIWILVIMFMVKIMPRKSAETPTKPAEEPPPADTRLWIPDRAPPADWQA
jgi:preprotein translocase subunit SecG